MRKWAHSINIKQHIGGDTSNEAIVKAAKGIVQELVELPGSVLEGAEDIVWEFGEMSRCKHDPEDNYDLLECFNEQLNNLYDWADEKRVWLGL